MTDHRSVFSSEWVFVSESPSFTLLTDVTVSTVMVPVVSTLHADAPALWVVLPHSAWPKLWRDRPFASDAVLRAVKTKVNSGAEDVGVDQVLLDVVYVLITHEAAEDLSLLDGRDPSIVFETQVESTMIPILPFREDLLANVPVLGHGTRPPKKKPSDDGFATGFSGDGDPSLEARVQGLDKKFDILTKQLASLIEKKDAPAKSPEAPSAPISSSPKEQLDKLGLPPEQRRTVEDLIAPTSRLLSEKRRVTVPRGPLSESEEEVPEDVPAAPPADQAVLMLTKLLKQQSKATASFTPLSRVYQSLTPASGGEEGRPISVARGAQGYLALRSLVKDHPALVVKMCHKNMLNRCSTTSEAALGTQVPSARYYVEHRSLITNHIANANWSWLCAAIADLLSQDPPNVDGALARALIGIACSEQISLDGGSWLYAADMMMHEIDTPLASFEGHCPSASRTPHSLLLDPQWFEATVARIRSLEESLERKSRLLKSSQENSRNPNRGGPPRPPAKAPEKP